MSNYFQLNKAQQPVQQNLNEIPIEPRRPSSYQSNRPKIDTDNLAASEYMVKNDNLRLNQTPDAKSSMLNLRKPQLVPIEYNTNVRFEPMTVKNR